MVRKKSGSLKILLTGPPASGKTRLVLSIADELRKAGLKVAGIISPEVREHGERWGFRIMDLVSSKERVLASVGEKKGPKVGSYGVNVDNVNAIVAEFKKSLPGADVVIIDEIGTMELYSRDFAEVAESVLKGKTPVLAVVHRSIADRYKNFGELIWVTPKRAAELKKELVLRLLEGKSARKKLETGSPLEHALRVLQKYEEGAPPRGLEEEEE